MSDKINFEQLNNFSDEQIADAVKAGVHEVVWNVTNIEVDRSFEGRIGCTVTVDTKSFPYIYDEKAEVVIDEKGYHTETYAAEALQRPIFWNLEEELEKLVDGKANEEEIEPEMA